VKSGIAACEVGGGIGTRSVVSLIPSANKASATSTSASELMSPLLPTRLGDVVDSGVATAMLA
jgi:hypothetical protein